METIERLAGHSYALKKMHPKEEAKEAGDTVAEFIVGSCSFLRRIAVEEGAGKMISY